MAEVPAPQLLPGFVLVSMAASVVSAGGWARLGAVCAEESGDDQAVAGKRLAVDVASFLNAVRRRSSVNPA